jgi:hypothetical protein
VSATEEMLVPIGGYLRVPGVRTVAVRAARRAW